MPDSVAKSGVALDALCAVLRECDPDGARCPLRVTHQHGGSGLGLVTTHAPCVRSEGHTGACSDTFRDIGRPGHAVLSALVEEVATLRESCEELGDSEGALRYALESRDRELRKWRFPDVDGERLKFAHQQYRMSGSREVASKVVYITALLHALGHVNLELETLRTDLGRAPAWRAIADEMPPKVGTILLGNKHGVLGRFSGVTCHAAATANDRPWAGATWFIDDALYDGDDDPTHWIAIPAVST